MYFSSIDCGFSCHWKCIMDIRRVCAHVIASEAGGYIFTKEICPEKGLAAQGYRCAECQTKITFSELIFIYHFAVIRSILNTHEKII